MTPNPKDLIISARAALLGEVRPNLRALTLEVQNSRPLLITYYFEDSIFGDEHNWAEETSSDLWVTYLEIVGGLDNPDDYSSNNENGFPYTCRIQTANGSSSILWKGWLVYHRYESNFQCDREPFLCPRLDPSRPDPAIAQMVTLRALVGKVTPELRDVFVAPRPNSIDLHFYFDGPISNLAITLVQRVKDSVMQFIDDEGRQPEIVKTHLIRLDYPTRPPFDGLSVYSRYEPTPPT